MAVGGGFGHVGAGGGEEGGGVGAATRLEPMDRGDGSIQAPRLLAAVAAEPGERRRRRRVRVSRSGGRGVTGGGGRRESSRPVGVAVPVRSLSRPSRRWYPGLLGCSGLGFPEPALAPSLARPPPPIPSPSPRLPCAPPPATSVICDAGVAFSLPLWALLPPALARAPVQLPWPDEVGYLVDPHWRWPVGGHRGRRGHPDAAEPAAEPAVAGSPPQPRVGRTAVALPRRAVGAAVHRVFTVVVVVVVIVVVVVCWLVGRRPGGVRAR